MTKEEENFWLEYRAFRKNGAQVLKMLAGISIVTTIIGFFAIKGFIECLHGFLK